MVSTNVEEKAFADFFRKYNGFLTPYLQSTQLVMSIKGEQSGQYPLRDLISDSVYHNSTRRMLTASDRNQRTLAYLLVASAGDRNVDSILLQKIKDETDENAKFWLIASVLYLKIPATSMVFEYLAALKDVSVIPSLFPLFVQQPVDSLESVAYRHIHQNNPVNGILAAQLFYYLPHTEKAKNALWKAVDEWDMNVKGYALFPLAAMGAEDVLTHVKLLLDDPRTRQIAFTALANSPSFEDKYYLDRYADEKKALDREYLLALLNSPRIEHNRLLLMLLVSKTVPEFFYTSFLSLKSDSHFRQEVLLPDIHYTIKHVNDAKLVEGLLRLLAGHHDSLTTSVCIQLLAHQESSVRSAAAYALAGNKSPELRKALPALIKNPVLRVSSLTPLLIEHNINNLHSVFDQIRQESRGWEWQNSALSYYIAFPDKTYLTFFRTTLGSDDVSLKRQAAIGLGLLHDTASIDSIIAACEKEAEGSDLNTHVYLRTLARLKGLKARNYIVTFLDSQNKTTADLAMSLLKQW